MLLNKQFMNNNQNKIKSPCLKICKYDKAFLNGMVCIGCFREQLEITNWIKMAEEDKKKSLLDSKERKKLFDEYNR